MPFLAQEFVPIPNKDLLSWMFDEPKYDLDKPVYIDANDPSRTISGRQARVIIRKLIAGLRAAGVKPGDCVCVSSFNDLYYPLLFLGIVGVGGVFAGTNPAYTPFELVHHFKTSRTNYVISEPEILGPILEAAKECNVPQSNIWIFDTLGQPIPSGFRSWKTLMDHGEQDWVRFNDEKVSKATTAARLYSSGTTGLPKAAALSHYNLVAQHMLVNEYKPMPYKVCRVLYLPMFHAATVPVGHVTPLRSGDKTYILRRFDLEQVLAGITKYGVTDLILVPPVVLAILKFPNLKKYSLKSVKSAVGGAGGLDKQHQLSLQALLSPEATFTQVWGMTETSCVASIFYYPAKDDTGSVGFFMPNLDVKLADDDGKDITGYDVKGEMCIRGPTIISSYFNNPKATEESFDEEGYFKTGDIMYCDSKTKKWYIIDRKKELIKVRGFQVAPGEIEALLLAHSKILDASVIGVQKPGDPDNEHPRAYVVKAPGVGNDLDEASIKAYCGSKLTKYKELTGGVRFVDAIPRNAAGKPLKRLLREMAKAELGGQGAKL